MLTDFCRGLGYGLIVALACAVSAFWIGQDHAPAQPVVSSEWIPSCEPSELDGVNVTEIAGTITAMDAAETVDEAVDKIVAGRNAAEGCEYNGEIWVCSNGLSWLASELNSSKLDEPIDYDSDSITILDAIEAVTDVVTCSDHDGDGEVVCSAGETP